MKSSNDHFRFTAAHCMQNKEKQLPRTSKDLILLLGAFDLEIRYEVGRTVVSPLEIIIHSGWNPFVKRFHDDIAVLLTESKIHYTDYIRPICMLSSNNEEEGTDGTVAGWGKSEGYKIHETIPRVINIPIAASNEECYRRNYLLAKISWDKSFCAGRPGVGVCAGDSGSAFMVKINGKFYFKGLVSSSLISETGCYTKDYAIYTDVPKYFDFIENPVKIEIPQYSELIESLERSIEKGCGVMSSSTSLVIGGSFSSQEQFPWLVAVWKGVVGHYGSGSLVTNRHVVTTAIEVSYLNSTTRLRYAAKPNEIRLYLGTTKYESNNEPGSMFVDGVKDVVVYPGARDEIIRIFNIAVVTMNKPIAFSSVISPVCLWEFGSSITEQVGQTAFGVGYGWDESYESTGIKKHVSMKIDEMERCRNFFPSLRSIPNIDFFCASGQNGNIAFSYDSPLYLKKNNKWFLRGLFNSYDNLKSTRNINTNGPILYENIGYFLQWIQQQIDL